jgi:hypothetical protein
VKIFISWSGIKSKTVATVLRQWIPDVFQTVEPWMSTDIDAGARWNRGIDKELSETNFGIICLTKANLNAPWILFEVGALAKTLIDTFVCPYLIDLEPSDIPKGPLAQFQAERADEVGTWELVCTINKALKDAALPEEKLKRTFDRWWPDLRLMLKSLPIEDTLNESHRSLEDMIEEMLELVRGLSRRRSPEAQEGFIEAFLFDISTKPEARAKLRDLIMDDSMASRFGYMDLSPGQLDQFTQSISESLSKFLQRRQKAQSKEKDDSGS